MTGVRAVRKAERRRDILIAAAEVFSEIGYRGASIGLIAERMGKPKSAVGYHHFSSKHEIAVEIVEHTRSRWLDLIGHVTDTSASGLVKLFTLLLSAALDARGNVLAAAAVRLAAEARVNGFDLPPAAFSWRGLAHDLVWDSIEAGELPLGSLVDEIVSLVMTGSYGVFISENQGFEDPDTEEHLRGVWRTLLPTLGVTQHESLLENVQALSMPESWSKSAHPAASERSGA